MTEEGGPLPERDPGNLLIQIDGASKGNPGPAGIGVILISDSGEVHEISEYVGVATNNVAEYLALLTALEEALIRGVKRLTIETDSELLAKQINREYNIKSQNLRFLFRRAKRLMAGFEEVTVSYIPREQNTRADMLAQEAVPLPGKQSGFFRA
jgi:ribonuclease HI